MIPAAALWRQNPDFCCHIRKTEVLDRALDGFAAWITGRKRFQGGLRSALPTLEGEPASGRIKLNPLAPWSADDVERYRLLRNLPAHPLVADGFASIGCVPCTRRVAPGEPPRAGRWWGLDKSECGIPPAGVRTMTADLLPPAFAPGSVWLVGAGPGDPGLLTLHAARALALADVILHDALIAPEILALAGAGARLEAVGKRAGRPSARQLWINQRLIELARAQLRVVRLKGGDPFVFGRGGEEALALAAAGVPFRVVPGITSGLAAPAYAGIPATHRMRAQTVAFVTGHNAGGGGPRAVDWTALAKGAQTIVLYMGLQRLPEIATALLTRGPRARRAGSAPERGHHAAPAPHPHDAGRGGRFRAHRSGAHPDRDRTGGRALRAPVAMARDRARRHRRTRPTTAARPSSERGTPCPASPSPYCPRARRLRPSTSGR